MACVVWYGCMWTHQFIIGNIISSVDIGVIFSIMFSYADIRVYIAQYGTILRCLSP